MNTIIVYTHPDCLLKFNGVNHPEKRERLISILNSIKNLKHPNIKILKSDYAAIEDIYLVHPKNYINDLFKKIPNNNIVSLEEEPYADTFLCPDSKNAILASCGAGITAAKSIMRNDEKLFFCAIRPPGHHAEISRANGFCFVNNIAVTARFLQKNYKIKRISIIDFDIHHGNETQQIFYNDKNIIYSSIHQTDIFPGSGKIDETGNGNIFNVPIKPNTTSFEFIDIFKNNILPDIENFKPEIILISAGFDGHRLDPLASTNLESIDFYTITKMINISNNYCDGRIISFFEGGYNIKALEDSIIKHLLAMVEN